MWPSDWPSEGASLLLALMLAAAAEGAPSAEMLEFLADLVAVGEELVGPDDFAGADEAAPVSGPDESGAGADEAPVGADDREHRYED